MTRRTRIALGTFFVMVAVALVLLLRQENRQAAVPPSPSPSPQPNVVVRSVEGVVETRGGTEDWTAITAGDALTLEHVLRTGSGGSAVVDLGDQATVRVAERSQIAIAKITEAVARVRLDAGQVSADVLRQESKLQVEVRGSDAVAEAGPGKFAMITDGDGNVSVLSSEGHVGLTAGGKTVDVGPGEQSVVRPRLAPSAPEKIPSSLFVKLAAPASRTQRERETIVRGSTVPGAMVTVNGKTTAADERGQFEAPVPLREGRNRVLVEVRDAAGRKKVETLPDVTVDSKGPAVEGEVKWR